MSNPNIADKKPAVVELEPGTYYWCRCGYSQKQPFCDGAHQGTDLAPLSMEVKEKQRVALCNCKYTNNPPYCDGNHSKI